MASSSTRLKTQPGPWGFTLLELSIVLVIIAVVIGGGLAIFTSSLQASQYNATVKRMDEIEKALLDFAVAHNRIPCPSDLTQTASSTTFGYEAGAGAGSTIGTATGACNGSGMSPQANFLSLSGAAEGGVPTRALQLPDEYMYDGWGRKFRYAVDATQTASNALPARVYNACSGTSPSAIKVNDASGAARTTTAGYAIISHGANGHGAYTSSGATFNAASVNADELTNCHCTSAGTYSGSYMPTYVEKVPMQDASNALDNFDDIVTFKEPWQMQALNFSLLPSTGMCIYLVDNGNDVIRKINPTGTITTYAGNGTTGYTGDGGPATSAELNNSDGSTDYGVAADGAGNLYIGDAYNEVVRKVDSSGTITTFAGNGAAGHSGDGGPATSAELNFPYGGAVAVDTAGNLYIADFYNTAIRKVTAGTGIITTVAGGYGQGGFSGDGGPATSASMWYPEGVAVDSAGNIYISDSYNNRVRKVWAGSGIITTVAGNGTAGYSGDGGPATSAELGYGVQGLAVDSTGNLYIADAPNQVVRKVSPSGVITTVAGNGTRGWGCSITPGQAATTFELNGPYNVAVDSTGNLYIGTWYNFCLLKVDGAGTITAVAGNGNGGYTGDGGPATSAEVSEPTAVAVSR